MIVLLALLVITLGAWAGRAEAADNCWFPDRPNTTAYASSRCALEITWPTVWNAVGPVDEPSDDQAEQKDNLIGSAANPGMYVAKKSVGSLGTFLFFRMRVNWPDAIATDGKPYTDSPVGTAYWMLTTNAPNDPLTKAKPYYSISWDMQNANDRHGLEMEYQHAAFSSTPLWMENDLYDVDDDPAKKCEYDIDGGTGASCGADYTRKEGYVRTVGPNADGSTFIDFAVRCSYFTRVAGRTSMGSFNPCTQTFYSSVAIATSLNDNNPWSTTTPAKIDVFGRVALEEGTPISPDTWGPAFNPTVVVITDLHATARRAGVEVEWETGSEEGTAGFNLYRLDPDGGARVKVNGPLVPAILESPNGGRYLVRDPRAPPVAPSAYLLEEIERDGTIRTYGPFTAWPQQAVDETGDARVGARGWARMRRTDDPGAARLHGAHAPDDETRSYGIAASKVRRGGKLGRVARSTGWARVIVSEEGLQALRADQVAGALAMTDREARAAIRGRALRLVGPDGAVACEPSPDGTFLYFHGKPLDTTWADSSVYQLTRGKCEPFEEVRGGAPRGAPPTTFVFTDLGHVEQDRQALPPLFRDPSDDFWLWNQLFAGDAVLGVATYQFIAADATGAEGSITANLQGETSTNTGRDHHVRLSLNGTELGEVRWVGEVPASATFTVPAGLMASGGANEIRLDAILDPGQPYSVIGLDSFDVSWRRYARAGADRLLLPRGIAGDVVVDGFTGKDIWVLDLGDPSRPRRVTGVATGSRAGAEYARFSPTSGAGPFLVIRPAAAFVPSIEAVPERVSLAALGLRRVDHLIVTSERLAPAALQLAALREAGGLRSVVVTSEQIYDEYGGGIPDPRAIRAFLADVYRKWPGPPRFVVLAGSGTFDGRGITGLDDNHVPPMMVASTRGLGPSDVALADVEGEDGVPEFAIGRIPAKTQSELLAYVEKLRVHESGPGPWSQRAFFLSDNGDAGGDFAADSATAAARLGGAMAVEQVNLAGDVATTRARTMRALNEGVGLFHYFGHASVARLASEGLITSADVDTMANDGRATVALLMTCVTGRQGYPGYDTLAMRLTTRSVGGSIATVAASSLQMEADSLVLSQGILSALASDRETSIGEAFRAGLATSREAGTPLEMRLTYALFGDPAVRLPP